MPDEALNYYILFANYPHGLALKELLSREQLPARIAPTPRSIQGKLTCGMSLLVKAEDIDRVRTCIQRNNAVYYDIVAMPCQIQPRRDRYC